METCANCGRTIGNLETPHLFREQVVCPECANRLSRQVNPPPMLGSAQTVPVANPGLSQGSSPLRIILIIAGVLFSVIAVVFLIALVGTGVRMSETMSDTRKTVDHLTRRNNLRSLHQAIHQYTATHGRILPSTLGDLAKHDPLAVSIYVQPNVTDSAPINMAPDQLAKWVNEHTAFEFPAAGKDFRNLPPDTVMAYEKESANGGRYFLQAEGYVEFTSDREADELIDRINQGHPKGGD